MKNKKFYLVLGMHRSGTSLVANLLHNHGIDMGQGHWKPGPNEDNPNGYFEDYRFRAINDDLLKASKYHVKDWEYRIPHIATPNKKINKRMNTLKSIIAKKERPCGAKDPRFCLTWRRWRFDPEITQVVFVYRDVEAVINSMIKREPDKFSREHWQYVWTSYNAKGASISQLYDTITVSYEQILDEKGIKALGIHDSSGIIDERLNRSGK